MTYLEAVRYLETLLDYEKIPTYPYKESLRLKRVKDFLEIIDTPQESLRCMHIAGTKGKGSTCAFVAYILRQAGYRVGLYTSPHLYSFRERIRILNPLKPATRNPQPEDFEGMICKKDLAALVERLRPLICNYNKNSKYGPLTFFEVYTSLAFLYFKEKGVDFAVLETGLGGRLDATNVVEPLVCAITSISYEHTQKLGNTLTEIANEKAGIIKVQNARRKMQNLIVITAPQNKEVIKIIRRRCKTVGAKLYELNKDIVCRNTNKDFRVKGIFGEYPNLKIRLLGNHQVINAAVAIGIIEALRCYNINVDINSVRKGLYNTLWPGRCEVVSKNPLVILDGAQNISSSRCLKETIKENFRYRRLILVLGISSDKDIKGIYQQLCSLADVFILTEANTARAASTRLIEQTIRDQKPECASPIIKTKNVEEARQFSRRIVNKRDLILVCGSLFVVGEFRNGKIRYQ